MIEVINTPQLAMIQDQLKLQSVNQNITNMQTPGYKSQLLENIPFLTQVNMPFAIINQSMQMDRLFTQGTVISTQNPRDLAISGNGFFMVQNAEGIFYTRRGDLRLNERGELSLADGALILGKAGPLQVDSDRFTIDPQGFVFTENRKIGQLNVVQFSELQKLNYRGQGLYETGELPTAIDNTTRVLQGFVEQSNVKAIDEMLAMMKISNHFTASQQILRTADNLLNTAIQQLGE